MLHHYITRYEEDGRRYAEAWLQVDLFGRSWCFSRRRVEIWGEPPAGPSLDATS